MFITVKPLKTLTVPGLFLMLMGFCLSQTSAEAQEASPETQSPAASSEEKPQINAVEDEEIPPVGPNAIFPAVVARVDGSPILGRDLEAIVNRELAPMGNPEWRNLREDYRGQLTLAALNMLINSRLVYQEALASGMNATDEEVQAELKTITDSYDSDAELNAALAEQMMDRATLEENLSQKLAADKYIEEKIVKNIIVTPEEVSKYYAENPDEFHHRRSKPPYHYRIIQASILRLR